MSRMALHLVQVFSCLLVCSIAAASADSAQSARESAIFVEQFQDDSWTQRWSLSKDSKFAEGGLVLSRVPRISLVGQYS